MVQEWPNWHTKKQKQTLTVVIKKISFNKNKLCLG